MATLAAIEAGRKAVEAYRAAHAALYTKGWHKGIPDAHTPLQEKMAAGLKQAGFASVAEFDAASQELTASELKLNPLAKVWR